jgi:hypothetical protein
VTWVNQKSPLLQRIEIRVYFVETAELALSAGYDEAIQQVNDTCSDFRVIEIKSPDFSLS